MNQFDLPTNLEELYKAKTGSEHSPSTLKLYKSYLNKLAKAGFSSPKILIKEKKKVLEFVKTLSASYQKTAMTSIFYALSGYNNNRRNKGYYKDFYNKLGDENPIYQEYLAKKAASES